jgi:hypothetical protein
MLEAGFGFLNLFLSAPSPQNRKSKPTLNSPYSPRRQHLTPKDKFQPEGINLAVIR